MYHWKIRIRLRGIIISPKKAVYFKLMYLYRYLAYVIINILAVPTSNLFLIPECITAGGRAETAEKFVG